MIFEVEGSASDPAFSGPIELDVSPARLLIRWLGEPEWREIPWWTILLLLRSPIPQISDQLAELRDEAREQGYKEGIAEIGCGSTANRASMREMTTPAKKVKARKLPKAKALSKTKAKSKPKAAKKTLAKKATKVKSKLSSRLEQRRRPAAVGKKTVAKKAVAKAPAKKAVKAMTPHKKVLTMAKKKTVKAEYDHCIYVRFASDAEKEMVRKAAEQSGMSLTSYIAHFAAEAGRATLPMPAPVEGEKTIVGKGATKKSEYGSRVLVAFDSKAVKQIVVAAAKAASTKENRVSASAYITHFAVEAARMGAMVPATSEAAAAAS